MNIDMNDAVLYENGYHTSESTHCLWMMIFFVGYVVMIAFLED